MFSYSRLFRPWDISKSESIDIASNDIGASSSEKVTFNINSKKCDEKLRRNKFNREARLKKIRGQNRKNDCSLQQDSTITTTMHDDIPLEKGEKIKGSIDYTSPVESLSECCNRLLPKNEVIPKYFTEQIKSKTDQNQIKLDQNSLKDHKLQLEENNSISPGISPNSPSNMVAYSPDPVYSAYPGIVSDYPSPADLAQVLGVQSADPLFLESLAQGYAMELEYARIIHQENQTKLLNARKQRPKKYKCPHCHVGFSNNGQLKGHIRIHTGERPYKCDEKSCGKSFTRNEELTRHKRIHSGLRPYPCPTCGKKFGRRDHLKKHTRTHFVQAERMMPVFLPLSAVPSINGFPYLYGY